MKYEKRNDEADEIYIQIQQVSFELKKSSLFLSLLLEIHIMAYR